MKNDRTQLILLVLLLISYNNLSTTFAQKRVPNLKGHVFTEKNFNKKHIIGDVRILTLLICYLDTDSSSTIKELNKKHLYENDGYYSQYYNEASYGKIKIVGDLLGWFKLNRNSDNDLSNEEIKEIIVNNNINVMN